MSLGIYNDQFGPTDLKIMTQAFDRLCAERRLAAKDKDQREELAAEVIFVFRRGATSEEGLWRALSKRRAAGLPPLQSNHQKDDPSGGSGFR